MWAIQPSGKQAGTQLPTAAWSHLFPSPAQEVGKGAEGGGGSCVGSLGKSTAGLDMALRPGWVWMDEKAAFGGLESSADGTKSTSGEENPEVF